MVEIYLDSSIVFLVNIKEGSTKDPSSSEKFSYILAIVGLITLVTVPVYAYGHA